MTELSLLDGFLLGVGGGLVPELYGLWQLRKTPKTDRPDWLLSYFYWFITSVMVLIGGCVVWLYLKSGINVNYFMAVHLGIATPLIIGNLMKKEPDIS